MSNIRWWEAEIARLPGIIKKLDEDIRRATYGPVLRRLLEERQTLQGELNNALRAAGATKQSAVSVQDIVKNNPKAATKQFTHSEDYRAVTVCCQGYTLTARQAHIVEILYRAHACGNPEVSIAYILEKVGTPNGRWQDTFRSNPKARQALVTTGRRKGTLRLNL